MQDVLPEIKRWIAAGKTVAVAAVVRTWGSSPRPVGAVMGVNENGELTGSVSGGCVESAVIEAALEVIRTNRPQRLHYGVADETAWEVGLACGGEIEVFVYPLDEVLFNLQTALIDQNRMFATVTRINEVGGQFGKSVILLGKEDVRLFHGETMTLTLVERAEEVLAGGHAAVIEEAGMQYFVNVHLPPPKLIVVGGVHITIALVSLAKTLGFQTVVIDPRRAFGSEARFAHADELLSEWPDEALRALSLDRSTAVAVLTHDSKLDDPALRVALTSEAFYVGALGSSKTQAKRRERLFEAGLTEEQINRLHGPIGLDIGGQTPEEIALAIMAEIVQEWN